MCKCSTNIQERSLLPNSVSLTSICCEVLEHIIYSNISQHLKTHNILCDEQHGFRAKRSCETQLISTIHDLAKNIDNDIQTDAILLDLTKAFDRVPHKHLCNKLSYYGINGSTLKWIKNFLQGRTQQVIVEGHHSNSISVTSGVPQGTVLAPLLFLCYINNLPININSKIKLYADDVLIYRPIKSLDDYKILQEDLNTIDQWAVHCQARFNPDKCEHIRITNNKNPILSTYFILNTPIQTVSNITYLGVTIDEHLSWSKHIINITKKANGTRGFLQRNINTCPSSIKEICYKLMIRPIIEYASTIWTPHLQKDILKLETIQRRSARFVLNDYARLSSMTSMIQKLGWPTLKQRRDNINIMMLYKIIHNNYSSYKL